MQILFPCKKKQTNCKDLFTDFPGCSLALPRNQRWNRITAERMKPRTAFLGQTEDPPSPALSPQWDAPWQLIARARYGECLCGLSSVPENQRDVAFGSGISIPSFPCYQPLLDRPFLCKLSSWNTIWEWSLPHLVLMNSITGFSALKILPFLCVCAFPNPSASQHHWMTLRSHVLRNREN